MTFKITIREATLEDAGAIEVILRAIGWYERINKETPAQAQAQVIERLTQCLHEGTHTILVAELASGMVVGYTAVHWFPALSRGIDGYISELFVHPSVSDHGIGTLLLDMIKVHAVSRNCVRLILMNRRDRESYRRGFYASHGWEEVHEGAFFTLTLLESKSA